MDDESRNMVEGGTRTKGELHHEAEEVRRSSIRYGARKGQQQYVGGILCHMWKAMAGWTGVLLSY